VNQRGLREFFNKNVVGFVNKAPDNLYRIRMTHFFRKIVRKRIEDRQNVLSRDQVSQIREYWKPYTQNFRLDSHQLYTSVTGIFDCRYIPDDLYYAVINPYFNKLKSPLANKSFFPLLFDCKTPDSIVHKSNGLYLDNDFRIISLEAAVDLCQRHDSVIFKPSLDTHGGKKVSLVNCEDRNDLIKAFEDYSSVPSFIVQEVIKQHQSMSAIHQSSINTIRVVSLILNNKVHILSHVLRMGVNNSIVDNASSGGIVCGITSDGHLKSKAYSADGTQHDRHPQGFVFENYEIPSFDKILNLVKSQAPRLSYNKLIGWDISVGKDGEPVLIEANLESPQLDFLQYTNGPVFGDLTDDVLCEVFRK
jgi:hypothetical protein